MKRYLILILLIIISLTGLNYSFSLLSNSALNNNNIFNAAEIFPTKEATETVTVTPSVTVTTTPAAQVTGTVTPTQSPSQIPALANHVVISEVQIVGTATTQDFVELYNPTISAVNLSGWKLRKRISTGAESSLIVIPSGKSISAHGFFLWSNSANGFNSTVGADVSNTNTLAGDNSVSLLKNDDSVVDKVAWGNGTAQFIENSPVTPNPASGQSLERKAYVSSDAITMGPAGSDEIKGNGYDSDNNNSDFYTRELSQPQNSSSPTEIP